jgi:F-box protein 11
MARQIVETLDRTPSVAPRSLVTIPSIEPVTPPAATTRSSKGGDAVQAEAAATRGPTLKTEPPILVVDALHRGDYPTITDALNAAKAGTRILVRPGLYKEGIVIDKPVEIIGDGERNDIVVEAFGKDAILFRADMGRVVNLTLRQAGGGNWYGVDIAQGRLDLEECDITSQSLACVAIHGGADPRLRLNRIHHGKTCGVKIYDDGQGTLEDNEILAQTHSGIEITNGGNPTLRRNRIHHGKSTGVYVYGGEGTLEDNEIIANAQAGVTVTKAGNPTLRRNRISKNRYEGVWIYDNGAGVFDGNDLRDNVRGAWAIDPSSEANVTRTNNKK